MDSDFEIFSLKDSVWKLNTRVLVLESFITQRFGSNVLRDVVKNDPVSTSSSKSTPVISSTTSRAQKSSGENKIQPQDSRTSSVIEKNRDLITKNISTENQNQATKKKKRTKRVNSDESSEEEPTDNGNDKNDKSHRLRRTSTKKVKYNEEEDSSTEYYINNEDSDPEYFALLEPKSEVTDEVENDTDTEMTEAEIQNTTDISNKPSESALTKNEKTDHYQRLQKAVNCGEDNEDSSNATADTSTLKATRGRGFLWRFIKNFDSEEAAKSELRNDNWKIETRLNRKDGNKVIFRCGPEKTGCPARAYILVTSSGLVYMYRKDISHDHSKAVNPWGLSADLKTRINELMEQRLKPKMIMEIVEQEGFQITMIKLNNYMATRRKQICGSQKTKVEETSCEEMKGIPTDDKEVEGCQIKNEVSTTKRSRGRPSLAKNTPSKI